jgi:hypothetical protein
MIIWAKWKLFGLNNAPLFRLFITSKRRGFTQKDTNEEEHDCKNPKVDLLKQGA